MLSGFIFPNTTFIPSRIAQTTGSNLTMRLKNCAAIDLGTENMFFASGGMLTLPGDIDYGVSNVGMNSGGIVTFLPVIHNIFADMSLVASQDGTAVRNINRSQSCDSGMVMVNSKIWKHLFTGTTYTSSFLWYSQGYDNWLNGIINYRKICLS